MISYIERALSMDFRFDHQDSYENILSDLVQSQKAMELAVAAGKAAEISLPILRASPKEIFEINNSSFSHDTITTLIDRARKARLNSYAPYSHFNVGAAIFAENQHGKREIIHGCNVENAAYGSTICAERTAAFSAVRDGFRKFHACAVVGGFDNSIDEKVRKAAQKEYITPCGSCRQVTKEFEEDSCLVIIARDTGEVLITTLEWLLPCGFGPRSLGMDASAYNASTG